MLSPPDIAVIGALALIFFGPDQLPKVARKAGQVMRDVQNTSQSFIREMEKAADDIEFKEAFAKSPPVMDGPRPPTEKTADASALPEPPVRTHADAASEHFVPGPSPQVERDAHEDASGI